MIESAGDTICGTAHKFSSGSFTEGRIAMLEEDMAGIGAAVHAAARVLSPAGNSGVVVSWTTRDLLAGSNIRLESRGPQGP